MASETPKVGQIVEHHFLWVEEATAGQLEGRKPRPCLIVAVESRDADEHHVTVLPITSQPPRAPDLAVAVPANVKSSIGLDRSRPAWIVVGEANTFTWPGFDLVPQGNGSFVRGMITRGLFEKVREAMLSIWKNQGPRLVDRD